MNLTTCPKCKMLVLPKPDGTCPSCQAKIFQEEPGTISRTPVTETNPVPHPPEAQVMSVNEKSEGEPDKKKGDSLEASLQSNEWKNLLKEATALVQNGQSDRALALVKQALTAEEIAVGPDHPNVVIRLNMLGEL